MHLDAAPLAAPPVLPAGLVRRDTPVVTGFEQLIGTTSDDLRIAALRHGVEPAFATFDGDAWSGIDVLLRDALPLAPYPDLVERWRSEPLVEPVMDTSEAIAADVLAARDIAAGLPTIGPSTAAHAENLDFSDAAQVQECFFYLDDPLHRRRVNMLAELVVRLAVAAVLQKGSATVLEIGPGPSGLQRAAIARLAPELRAKVRFVGVDVSPDLLAYGVARGYLDEGVVADLAHFDAAQMQEALGTPDVVVACEILEHVQSSASVVDRGLLEWVGRSGAWLLGSVPNSIQGAELAGVFRADAAPHQLTRHLVDETTTHVAFYTYATLRGALRDVWSVDEAYIWGNALRLDRRGEAVCLDGALALPHRSDRLCFATRLHR